MLDQKANFFLFCKSKPWENTITRVTILVHIYAERRKSKECIERGTFKIFVNIFCRD